MPLINFGSILGFAEEIENQHLAFYTAAAQNPDCEVCRELFDSLKTASKKRIKEVLRVRRENVTEMILETIEGFHRGPFSVESPDVSGMTCEELIQRARGLVDRSMDYYGQAAQKLRGQAEVAGALKNLAKKHGRDRKKMMEA